MFSSLTHPLLFIHFLLLSIFPSNSFLFLSFSSSLFNSLFPPPSSTHTFVSFFSLSLSLLLILFPPLFLADFFFLSVFPAHSLLSFHNTRLDLFLLLLSLSFPHTLLHLSLFFICSSPHINFYFSLFSSHSFPSLCLTLSLPPPHTLSAQSVGAVKYADYIFAEE